MDANKYNDLSKFIDDICGSLKQLLRIDYCSCSSCEIYENEEIANVIIEVVFKNKKFYYNRTIHYNEISDKIYQLNLIDFTAIDITKNILTVIHEEILK